MSKTIATAIFALTAMLTGSVANAQGQGFPSGSFFMEPKGTDGLALDSDGRRKGDISLPGTDEKKSNTTGMAWKAIPAGDGYYYLTSSFHESKGMYLEGGSGGGINKVGGGAEMNPRKATGTLWKAVPAIGKDAPGYYLKSKAGGNELFLMVPQKGGVAYLADSIDADGGEGRGVAVWQFTPSNQ